MSEGTARAYVSEIVPPNRRTLYTALLNGIVFASQAFSVGIARYVHWRTMFAIAGFVPPVVCLSALYFIPNSPKWLLSHGHPEEEALRAVHFFHGKDADAEAEVHSIQASLKQTHVDGVSLPMRQLILRRETLWPLLLITVELFMYVWSGGMAIAAILPLVLNSVNLPLDEYQRAVMPAALSAILCLPTSFVIERFGRLPLLRVSGAISALGCTAIVSFSYLPEALQLTQGWLALLGAVLLQLTFSCIVLPIAYTYVNELLPNRTRTLCANVTMGTMYIDLFIFFKVFPMLVSSIGLGGVFIIHLLVSVSQIVFATFCLPETKDLSLEQIQKLFQTTKSTSGTASNAGDAKTGQAGEQDLALT
ncbi:facilitated trehalose transporter Tret1-like [Pollicipes pollicipes]|uniref:facilitated trehalose transporter Tret1-like n=1 Tax=Pollicipes pollicipes TaxID=41117 RepID=UPI00188566BB|nr:facilitated trehalose transporter Tret1-like [Pollicipes pollicipes]